MNWLERKASKTLFGSLLALIVFCLLFYGLATSSDSTLPSPTNPTSERVFSAVFMLMLGLYVIFGYFAEYQYVINLLDERERLIHANAKNISKAVFGGLWVIFIATIYVFYDLESTAPIYMFVYISIVIWLIAEIVRSLLILIQCKKDRRDA